MMTGNRKIAMDIVNKHFNAVHLRRITADDCDVLCDTILAALDEKDVKCERECDLAREAGIMQGVRR